MNDILIPEGWQLNSINTIFDFIPTSSYSRNDLNYNTTSNSILYIHYGDIHSTYKNVILDLNKESKVPVVNENIIVTKNFLNEGDLIIADASEDYEGIGAAVVMHNIEDRKVIAGLHTFALRDSKNRTQLGFRPYIFEHPTIKVKLKTIVTGSKVYGISKANLKQFKILLPPLLEQQK